MRIGSHMHYLRAAGIRSWNEKSSLLSRRFSEFARLFHKKGFSSPDELFFSKEDLPPLGKEYWFLHFNSPSSESQVVLTLGRSASAVRVNSSPLSAAHGRGGNGTISCAAVCWLYCDRSCGRKGMSRGKRKQVLFDSLAQVRISRHGKGSSLTATSGKNTAAISGVYPDFDVSLSKGGKRIFSARAFAPLMGVPYEFQHIINSPLVPKLSSILVNYYFDFEGTLLGKPFSGKAYLQKVVAVMPLAPWNWVRLNFASGASIDFFAGKPLGHKANVRFADNAYFEHNGKRTKLTGLALTGFFEGENRIWLMTGKNLFLSMRAYSLQPFIMKQRTTFRYDEYLVRATDFSIRADGREHSLSSLGKGVGIVEEASGYLL